MTAMWYALLIFACFCSSVLADPPEIKLVDPKVVTLKEDPSSSTVLSNVECEDPDGGSCSVSITNVYPSNPCGNCFRVYPCGVDYCLEFVTGQGSFSPSQVSQYLITVTASDEESEFDVNLSNDVIDVRIQPNALPFFDNGMSAEVTVANARNKRKGDTIYTVAATDPEFNRLTFTMTTIPQTDNLEIDDSTGEIRAAEDLIYECQKDIAAEVYVQDEAHPGTQVGPFVVAISLDGGNAAPIINNLDTTLRVREDEAVGTAVMRFAGFDDDTITYMASTSSDQFEIIGDELVVKTPLDYETKPKTVSMLIWGTDGSCESEKHQLTIRIVDINEPPTLGPIDQTVESCEGAVTILPKWNATDVDENDKITFIDIQDNDDGLFLLDETTGVVTIFGEYDVDQGNMAPTVDLVVTIADKAGETATATLTIRFKDCNDNHPIFTRNTYLFDVKDCFPAGYIVGNVRADDDDSEFEQNNVITYAGSGPGVAIQPGGTVVLTDTLEAGTAVTVEVYATDQGKTPGPLRSKSPTYVSVHSLPCIIPPPADPDGGGDNGAAANTTTAAPNEADFLGDNLGWFILAGLAALLLTGLTIYMLYRYCWPRFRDCIKKGCCKRKPPPRAVSPARRPTPPPAQPRGDPGFIFGWWKETYPNEDYNKVPDRNAVPEATKHIEVPIETNTYDAAPVLPRTPPTDPAPQKSCIIL